MLNEIVAALQLREGDMAFDGTLGGGGYARALADQVGASGRIIACDLDLLAIRNAEKNFSNKYKNIILANDNFKNLSQIAERTLGEKGMGKFDGIVFDLGLSSAQLEDRDRGFSFQSDNPLNMAFGQSDPDAISTYDIVNLWSREELARLFAAGEEQFAGRIAGRIVEERASEPIATTGRLCQIIKSALPSRYLAASRKDPATKVFQALRMATNQELDSLRQALSASTELLKPGGRVAVVSFHSLEDRIVKDYFNEQSRNCICPPRFPVCSCGHKACLRVITKRPLAPQEREIAANPRARSAKLRVAEKI